MSFTLWTVACTGQNPAARLARWLRLEEGCSVAELARSLAAAGRLLDRT